MEDLCSIEQVMSRLDELKAVAINLKLMVRLNVYAITTHSFHLVQKQIRQLASQKVISTKKLVVTTAKIH